MPQGEDGEDLSYLFCETERYGLVWRHFGISAQDAQNLDCLTFAKLARDALVLQLKETKEGREYLEKAHRLTQTAPDLQALRKQFT